MSNEKKVIEFNEIARRTLDSVGSLSDLVGQTIYITDVEFRELGNLGEVAIVVYHPANSDELVKRHTFSQVLIEQLKSIKDYLDQGYEVKAKIVKRKRYLTFE